MIKIIEDGTEYEMHRTTHTDRCNICRVENCHKEGSEVFEFCLSMGRAGIGYYCTSIIEAHPELEGVELVGGWE